MNFNLIEMYNGLLRFNKHILNELAEGLKHLPNLDGVSKGIRNGKAYYADSRDKTLFYSIHRLNHFPINFKITKYDWRIYAKNRKEKVKLKT